MEKQGKLTETQRELWTVSPAGLASLAFGAKNNTENMQRNKAIKKQGIKREAMEKHKELTQTQRELWTVSPAGLASLASGVKNNTESMQRNKTRKSIV